MQPSKWLAAGKGTGLRAAASELDSASRENFPPPRDSWLPPVIPLQRGNVPREHAIQPWPTLRCPSFSFPHPNVTRLFGHEAPDLIVTCPLLFSRRGAGFRRARRLRITLFGENHPFQTSDSVSEVSHSHPQPPRGYGCWPPAEYSEGDYTSSLVLVLQLRLSCPSTGGCRSMPRRRSRSAFPADSASQGRLPP